MIKKKVCMLGAFAAGKTSLVRRFIHNTFSDNYLTTLGVMIGSKTVDIGGRELKFVLWDIHGDDEFTSVRTSYLRGAAGFLLVVDGTRRVTLETALRLKQSTEAVIGKTPFLLLLNKVDLVAEWDMEDEAIAALVAGGWSVTRTSAKTGQGVEAAFVALAEKMLQQ